MSSELDLGSGEELDSFNNQNNDPEHLLVYPSIPITEMSSNEEETDDSGESSDQAFGDEMETSDNVGHPIINEGDGGSNSNIFPEFSQLNQHFLSTASQESFDNSWNVQPESGGKIRGNRVSCPQCGKIINKSSLDVHIRVAHPTGAVKGYSCSEEGCGRSFHTKKRLDYHLGNEHNEAKTDDTDVPDNRECPICKVVIKSMADYKYHVQREHVHSCEHCQLKFAAKQKLEEHVLNVHQIDIRVDKLCKLCGAVQRGLTDYYRHIVKDHNWSCDFDGCRYKFACKQKLEEHTLQAHNIDIKVEKRCTLCQQDIPSLSDFRQHIAREHKYACVDENCELRFASKEKFEQHTIQAHNVDVRIDRTCPQCQNLIRGLTDYFRHIQKEHKFVCGECPLKFAYKMKFEEHMLTTHGKDIKVDKTCKLCQTSIRSLTDYKRHIAMNHKFDCVCELKFACKQKLEEHTLKVHGIDIRVDKTCPMCKTSIRSLSDYNRHIATEHRWQCPHCELKFAYKQKLDDHGVQVHEVEIGYIPLFSCQTCGLTFDHKPVFENHLELPHTVACAYCDMMFTYHHKMVQHCEKDHQLLVESKEEQLTCKLCKLTFPTTTRMDQHSSMDHKFRCDEAECDLVFVSKFKLEEHSSSVHNVSLDMENCHACPICGQYFSRLENLKKHEDRAHEYQCDHCSKRFIARDRLEKHCIKEHGVLGEHPVDDTADLKDRMVCPMCDKNFRQLHILRKHKEIDHKFPCSSCDKTFTMKHGLKEHLVMVHDIKDDLKPSLKCELCDNIFTDNYGFKKHQKIEHTIQCSFCIKRFTMKKFLNMHQFYVHNFIAPGMKVPTQEPREEPLNESLKEQKKENKDPYFNIKKEINPFVVKSEPVDYLHDEIDIKGFSEFETNGYNEFKIAESNELKMNGSPVFNMDVSNEFIKNQSNGLKLENKKLQKNPPPPLIKIERNNSEEEDLSDEGSEASFINDAVPITDMQSGHENEENDSIQFEDDDDDDDEEDSGDPGLNDTGHNVVSVQPQYESSEEEDSDSEDEDGEDTAAFMEALAKIQEKQETS